MTLPLPRWQVITDFLVVAMAFYALLRWAKSARALRLALGVVGLHALALTARKLDLVITSWVLDASAILAILVLLLIFQPELRRAFMRVDSALRRWPRTAVIGSGVNRGIADAVFDLAAKRLGALLVIARRDSVGELIEGGTVMDATVSAELIEAIFQKLSPLHDGAVIIVGDRLVRAGAVLPLTRSQNVPALYGTRHRAAMGLAERCDALIAVVSEERSEVAFVLSGSIRRITGPDEFVGTLGEFLNPARKPVSVRVRGLFVTNLGLKFAALGLAAVIWSMSFLVSGTAIRTFRAPVELGGVPAGMKIDQQSTDTLEIQLRGSPWIMDSVDLGTMVAHLDLGDLHAGWQTLRFQPDSLDLPPGITVDRVTPPTVRVEVVQSAIEHPRRK